MKCIKSNQDDFFQINRDKQATDISSFGKVFGIQDGRSITYRFLDVRYYFIVLSFVKFRIGSPTVPIF